MIKTIFGKIMLLFMAIIMIALVLSGLMMSQIVRNAYIDDSKQQSTALADDVENLMNLFANGALSFPQLSEQITAKARSYGNAIWIIDSSGTPWLANDPNGKTVVKQEDIEKYYVDMIDALNEGKTVRKITEANNVFNTPMLTVATPIMSENAIIGYVFVHKQIYELEQSLMALYRQIVLAAGIAAALSIVLTYFFSKSMLRPLSVVTIGAKQLAKGDFDIHLKVSSKDEIGQLAETFNSVAMDLKKYEASRESLIANVSHELRSPLTSIQGLVQGALDGTIPKSEVDHYLEVVLGESKRLNLLITDMLDLAKIESGQFPMQIDRVELNELMRRVLISFESKINAKRLEIEVEFAEEKTYVMADMNRLTQVIHNILENAIKFVNDGGRLRLETKIQENAAEISVNNSGDVIAAEELPYLFDRFYKIDKSHTREKEGTGIGLSIVKNILKAHGQRIWVTSNELDGTTFTFTLKKAQGE
ncbi:MAG: ATP-binding protein [Christensenella sp.]